MSDSSEEKELPASDKKLDQAREKGQIPHSQDMVTAVVMVASFGYLMLRASDLTNYLAAGLAALPANYGKPFPEAADAVLKRLGADALATVMPLIGVITLAAVGANIVLNGGLVVSLDPIAPDAEKLDPVEGFKKIFGAKNVVDLIKSVLKFGVATYLVFRLITGALQALVEIPACGLSCAVSALGILLKYLFLIMAGLFLALGALDIGLQRWLFLRDQRMTKTEQKRETKDSDGDPLIKQEHRKENRVGDVKTGLRHATFAIRSPTAVLAMRYTTGDAPIPVLVARGTGEGMLLLLDELRSLGVPIVFDSATVAGITPRLKVGSTISQDMFEAVITCMRDADVL